MKGDPLLIRLRGKENCDHQIVLFTEGMRQNRTTTYQELFHFYSATSPSPAALRLIGEATRFLLQRQIMHLRYTSRG